MRPVSCSQSSEGRTHPSHQSQPLTYASGCFHRTTATHPLMQGCLCMAAGRRTSPLNMRSWAHLKSASPWGCAHLCLSPSMAMRRASTGCLMPRWTSCRLPSESATFRWVRGSASCRWLRCWHADAAADARVMLVAAPLACKAADARVKSTPCTCRLHDRDL